jgi:GTPase SAR1 family protein
LEKDSTRQLKASEIVGKKVLILGEAGSGKTKLAARLLHELMVQKKAERITVIDLAPGRTDGIGGKLTDYLSLTGTFKYLSPEPVYTPRLVGTTPQQILHYAELNRKSMEPLFSEFLHNVSEVLVTNDITLYFHAGRLETVLKCARSARTFLATAYYGSKLASDLGTGISQREREMTERLAKFMDLVVKIDQSSGRATMLCKKTHDSSQQNSFRTAVDVHASSSHKTDQSQIDFSRNGDT